MKALITRNPGKNSYLEWTDVPKPDPMSQEVIVKIHATAVNRADLLQRRGLYPPPEGASDILGLECAGEIVDRGAEVSEYREGDRVCALLAGGGYAEYVAVHQDMLLPVPPKLSFHEAAGIPESFYTAYLNLFEIGKLIAGEVCVIHSGGSGIGVAAIQLAKKAGAEVIATTGSSEKIKKCLEIGANHAFSYNEEPILYKIKQYTRDMGVDLVLDTIGARLLTDNISMLKYRGRIVIIGLLGGSKSEMDIGQVLIKNIFIQGSTLRNRSLKEKIILTNKIKSDVMPFFLNGKLRPIVDSVFSIHQAEEAHRRMAENKNFGKIILSIT